eukprot:7181811-Ditylum_brightwellii.AAC.1
MECILINMSQITSFLCCTEPICQSHLLIFLCNFSSVNSKLKRTTFNYIKLSSNITLLDDVIANINRIFTHCINEHISFIFLKTIENTVRCGGIIDEFNLFISPLCAGSSKLDPQTGRWQRLGIFCQVLEVQNTRFKSQMGAVEGGFHCCAFCDRGVWGWMKLDADGTM